MSGKIIVVIIAALIALIIPRFFKQKEAEEEGKPLASRAQSIPVPKPEPAAESALAPAETVITPDDLTRIEGIGPKISSVLQAAGIATFAQLAATQAERITEILEAEDPRLGRIANPATWAEQAQLAADKAWDALDKLQDELKGGRRI